MSKIEVLPRPRSLQRLWENPASSPAALEVVVSLISGDITPVSVSLTGCVLSGLGPR